MDDKKIFRLLQDWFPRLKQQEIPKKKHRDTFQNFLAWIKAEKVNKQNCTYLMEVDAENPYENSLERCAVLQHMNIDIGLTQQKIRERVTPLYQHYEKHKQVIGKYYNVHAHAFDIVFEEIFNLLKSQNFELLIIYAEKAYWMAMPNQDVKIH